MSRLRAFALFIAFSIVVSSCSSNNIENSIQLPQAPNPDYYTVNLLTWPDEISVEFETDASEMDETSQSDIGRKKTSKSGVSR